MIDVASPSEFCWTGIESLINTKFLDKIELQEFDDNLDLTEECIVNSCLNF